MPPTAAGRIKTKKQLHYDIRVTVQLDPESAGDIDDLLEQCRAIGEAKVHDVKTVRVPV